MVSKNCKNQIARSRFASQLFTTLALLMVMVAVSFAQQSTPTFTEGKIIGRMVDAETGEALIGVTVMLEGTKLGAVTDLDGNFVIKRVPVGIYTLVASSVGYSATKVTAVEVTDGEVERIDLALKPQILQTEGIEVTAKVEKNNEASLLKLRQKSNSVSDAISAEQITRSGSSDAASAMTRVTGASVVGGKYVYVRGMGDRYANTRINGSLAPSPDPDKQAVPLDMIPAALLDNIVVEKTFTPDKAGNFSGGSVDLTTKDMPEGRVLTFSSSASYNTQTTFEEGVLANRSADGDWLASSADERKLDESLQNPPSGGDITWPTVIRDTAKALLLQEQSLKVNKTSMTPVRRTAPLNQSYGISFGDTWSLFDMPLGFISTFSYGRTYTAYSGGRSARWYWSNSDYPLDRNQDLSDQQGKDEVLWGGLFNGTLRPHPNHKIGFTMVYNRNSESTARIVEGYNYNASEGSNYRSQSLIYSERILKSFQFKGEHAKLPFESRLNWQMAISRSSQDEPDMRYFSDVVAADGSPTGSIWLTYPSHYWRNLAEKNREGQVDWSLPFKQWSGLQGKFKMGGSYLHKTREFRERYFKLSSLVGLFPYNGDPDAFLDESHFGMQPDSTPDSYIDYGLSWEAYSDPKSNFDATQDVSAAYAMMELPISSRLNVIGGVRFETTEMDLKQIKLAQDTIDPIKGEDFLPSLNMIYKLSENINARVAYGRTLARPTLREISPHTTWEFVEGGYYHGDPNIKYTKIENYDARFEWFLRPGEILAISGFLKHLYDPIERKYTDNNGSQTVVNYNRANVYGLELEFRRRLDHVDALPFLRNFRIGGNFTLVHSEVKLTDDEYQQALRWDSATAEDSRPLQGQSPFVINLEVGYDNPKLGTFVSLMYNRFGDRLSALTLGVTPDEYERARTTVDMTVTQRLFGGVALKASGKNLTDSEYRESVELNGKDYITRSYKSGITYGFGVTYSL